LDKKPASQPVKMTPPPEAMPNFGRAIGHLAAEIAKLPKEALLNKREGA
jgi:hypothetical protein